jgi:hypothetical protein
VKIKVVFTLLARFSFDLWCQMKMFLAVFIAFRLYSADLRFLYSGLPFELRRRRFGGEKRGTVADDVFSVETLTLITLPELPSNHDSESSTS